jgi:outer membrane protein assembly factor BamD
MFRRALIAVSIGAALLAASGCTNKKVNNPIANVDSKQPDKVLFDRAMDAMKHNKFDVARVTLQTLINTYPDSEYIARAKLAIGDSWYAEGGTAAMSQAENEYKDFQTFFPNMPEAAEAQMKIANIHYNEMEKPDRDYTHAKRAEEEYRQMMLQYPDSKLLPQAKRKLIEVQEVLAEREFQIGRFYYMKQDYPAAIARLKSMSDAYPLYSKADETLFMLGLSYQAEADLIRRIPSSKLPEVKKAALVKRYEKDATSSYSKIVTRYPVMARAEAAKKRLAELHEPVPTPTPEALAQNKAEQQSRGRQSKKDMAMGFMHHRPDVSPAAKVGEPTIVDPPQTSAVELVRNANATLVGPPATMKGGSGLALETTGTGPAPANEAVPRSDNGASGAEAEAPVEAGKPTPAAPSTSGGTSSTTDATTRTAPATPPAPVNNAATDSSTTTTTTTAPAAAPARVNDAATDPADSTSGTTQSAPATAAAQSTTSTDTTTASSQDSSSKKKKKKGLSKLNPF